MTDELRQKLHGMGYGYVETDEDFDELARTAKMRMDNEKIDPWLRTASRAVVDLYDKEHAAEREAVEEDQERLRAQEDKRMADEKYKEEAIDLFHEATAKLGKERVAELVAYCAKEGKDPVGTLKAEIEFHENRISARSLT